ncbi:hypothetical protein ABZ281_02640 [Streptomyces sp. NPDC006265]|uniref:hypothetical protein n=1 Tax=Streptomyces sp. NPDC006265 TaxID=3156740 RepID=UPI0033BD5573
MADISTADLAEAAAELVISRLDEKYSLVYVDRGDCLTDEQIGKMFAGEEEVLDSEWESENRWHGENAVLDNLLDEDARDFLAEHDALERVRAAISERDESDPLGDLMRETGSKLFRYRLDAEAEADPWRFSDEKVEDAARTLGSAAGLDFLDNAGALRELVAHASYGGGLYVLWRGDVKPVYDAVCKIRWNDPAPEITVQWTDPELLVLDTWNGAGHSVRVRGTVRLPFAPDRLSLDVARSGHGYSWTDTVGGGYQPEGDEPEFIESDAD